MDDSTEQKIAELRRLIDDVWAEIATLRQDQRRSREDVADIFKEMLAMSRETNRRQERATVAAEAVAEQIRMIAQNDLEFERRLQSIESKVTEMTYWAVPTDYEAAIDKPRTDTQNATKRLIEMMADLFTRNDLDELVIDCGFNRELGGNTKKIYAANIIEHAKQTSRFTTLIQQLAHKRPNVKWPFGTGWLQNDEKR